MDIRDIQQKRANLWEEAKKFLDEHTDKDGKISAEDAATYDKMENEIVDLGKQIDRLKRQESLNTEINALSGTPMLPNPNGTGDSKVGRASDAYRKAAIEAVRSKFHVIRNDLATSPDSAGGYLVPAEWDTRLIQTLEEENVMRTLGTKIQTSGEHRIPIVATKPVASWTAEGQVAQFSNATFTQVVLNAHKVAMPIRITEELLADNVFDLESFIIEQSGKSIGNIEEEAFIVGDGNGKPTGFLTTIGGDSTAYNTTKGAEPTADEILDLIYKLPRTYRKDAVFLVNDSTLALLRKFKDQNQRYLWEESYQAGEPSRLLGHPVYTSPYMPTAQSGNFAIAFGDFSCYYIGDRGERSFQVLNEIFAASGHVGFIMKERVDGILTDNNAIRALKIK